MNQNLEILHVRLLSFKRTKDRNLGPDRIRIEEFFKPDWINKLMKISDQLRPISSGIPDYPESRAY